MAKANQKPPKIVSNIPAVVADGHGLGISDNGDVLNLLFIQITKNNEETGDTEATVVSNIRLSRSQAEQLHESLGEALAKKSATTEKR